MKKEYVKKKLKSSFYDTLNEKMKNNYSYTQKIIINGKYLVYHGKKRGVLDVPKIRNKTRHVSVIIILIFF